MGDTIKRSYQESAFKISNTTRIEEYRQNFVTGTPERIRAVIEGFINLGVTNIIVSFMDPEFRDNDFHSLELFSKEVIGPIRTDK